jgi:hypothetical protein
VRTHNEKMLPRSYSIAGWQQWLCITFYTVWCITTTLVTQYTGLRRLAPCFRYRRSPGHTLYRGPDFAERSLIQSFTVLACNVAHTAQHYFVVDFG